LLASDVQAVPFAGSSIKYAGNALTYLLQSVNQAPSVSHLNSLLVTSIKYHKNLMAGQCNETPCID